MSFRKEIKLKIETSRINDFKNFLFERKFSEQYPQRIVESIYFDNLNFQMFQDSIEGSVPRKKIRLRSYNKKKIIF